MHALRLISYIPARHARKEKVRSKSQSAARLVIARLFSASLSPSRFRLQFGERKQELLCTYKVSRAAVSKIAARAEISAPRIRLRKTRACNCVKLSRQKFIFSIYRCETTFQMYMKYQFVYEGSIDAKKEKLFILIIKKHLKL